MTSESVVMTIRLHARKRPDETRKYLTPKDKAYFNEFVDRVEKLFGCKICESSFIYLDGNGERISFSSDQELALAFLLLKGNILRIEVTETDQQVPGLKEDNPSEMSTDCSLDSSMSGQHGHSPTSSCSSTTKTVGATTPKSTNLFRSIILPKLSKQFESSPAMGRKKLMKMRQSGHHEGQEGEKLLNGDILTMDLASSESWADDCSRKKMMALRSCESSPVNASFRLSPSPKFELNLDLNTLNDLVRAILRIVLWLGERLA